MFNIPYIDIVLLIRTNKIKKLSDKTFAKTNPSVNFSFYILTPSPPSSLILLNL